MAHPALFGLSPISFHSLGKGETFKGQIRGWIQNLKRTLGAVFMLWENEKYEWSLPSGKVKTPEETHIQRRRQKQSKAWSRALDAALPGGSGRCRRAADRAPGLTGNLARLRRCLQGFCLFKHFEEQFHPNRLVVIF
jgi:hypothetical protein